MCALQSHASILSAGSLASGATDRVVVSIFVNLGSFRRRLKMMAAIREPGRPDVHVVFTAWGRAIWRRESPPFIRTALGPQKIVGQGPGPCRTLGQVFACPAFLAASARWWRSCCFNWRPTSRTSARRLPRSMSLHRDGARRSNPDQHSCAAVPTLREKDGLAMRRAHALSSADEAPVARALSRDDGMRRTAQAVRPVAAALGRNRNAIKESSGFCRGIISERATPKTLARSGPLPMVSLCGCDGVP